METAKPFISVIVPVYKVEDYLRRCVDSLVNQTYEPLEIILVDDGSPDSCGIICDELSQLHSNIRVIHKENGGLSSARNAGIEIAKGDYLGFVDSDDWVEPEMYETMIALAQKHDVPLVYAGRFDEHSADGRQEVGLCPPEEEVVTGEELARRIFRWQNVDSAAWDKLYRRELFQEIRYPLGVIGEDVPTTYRLALLAGKAAACPKPLYHYFHRQGSITTSAFSNRDLQYLANCFQVEEDIRENWPELTPEAEYLKTVAVAQTLQTLEISAPEVRKQFAEEQESLRKILKSQLWFVSNSGFFDKQKMRDYTLMAMGLYRIPRTVYHFFKRKA